MHFTTIVLALCLNNILAAPIPQDSVAATSMKATRQLAGEGAACNSVLSQTDNGVGYGVENAEDGVASTVSSAKARRQLAGEGAACDSVLTQTDNGVGYGVENAEDNTASTVSSTGAKSRRQLDKISNGAQAVSNSAGTGKETENTTTALDNIDGTLTSGAANTGADVGNTEAGTLEAAGSAVPKARRQLDKISNGLQTVSQAAGTGANTEAVTGALDTADGTLTSDAANAGAQVGDTEDSTLEGAGKAVPKV